MSNQDIQPEPKKMTAQEYLAMLKDRKKVVEQKVAEEKPAPETAKTIKTEPKQFDSDWKQTIDDTGKFFRTAFTKIKVNAVFFIPIIILIFFLYCVWPTPYRYLNNVSIGNRTYPVRVNRITGKTEYFNTQNGWRTPM